MESAQKYYPMDRMESTRELFRRYRCAVVIPTYNNSSSLAQVVESVLRWAEDVIVVDDGSNDSTVDVLRSFAERIDRVGYAPNRGKGYALRRGFERARERGFERVVTIDSDGQHFADDLPLFANAMAERPDAMLIGSRTFSDENMPSGNRFANRFSNFWFAVQTLHSLPDTQTGYRLYPLSRLGRRFRPLTRRYESELEMLVRAAWRGVELIPISIRVYYAPEGERVTHFRPGCDFMRITLLNTLLCFAAAGWGYWSMAVRRIVSKGGGR